MFTNLQLPIIRLRAEEIDARAQRLGPLLAAADERRRAAAQAPITVRHATADDGRELTLLAELDSAPPVRMPALIGERCGVAVAALSLRDDAVVANPFVPTLDVVALLRMRGRQLRHGAGPSRRILGLTSAAPWLRRAPR